MSKYTVYDKRGRIDFPKTMDRIVELTEHVSPQERPADISVHTVLCTAYRTVNRGCVCSVIL